MDILNSSDFEEKVIKSQGIFLVDFFAPWCGPCQMAMPILEKISQDFKDKLSIFKVDVDQNQDLAQKYNVMSIPTLILFKNGQAVETKVGFPGESGLKDFIAQYIS